MTNSDKPAPVNEPAGQSREWNYHPDLPITMSPVFDNPLTHSGFDKLLIKDKEAINAGSFHHQLHHRYFECNYGSEEIPLDRWFGSFHDGTQAASKRIRARKKMIFARK